jgi:hypothetical protein
MIRLLLVYKIEAELLNVTDFAEKFPRYVLGMVTVGFVTEEGALGEFVRSTLPPYVVGAKIEASAL